MITMFMAFMTAFADGYDEYEAEHDAPIEELCVRGSNLQVRDRLFGGVVVRSYGYGPIEYELCSSRAESAPVEVPAVQPERDRAVDAVQNARNEAPVSRQEYERPPVDSMYAPVQSHRRPPETSGDQYNDRGRAQYEDSLGALEAYRRQKDWNEAKDATTRAAQIDAANARAAEMTEADAKRRAEERVISTERAHKRLQAEYDDYVNWSSSGEEEEEDSQ